MVARKLNGRDALFYSPFCDAIKYLVFVVDLVKEGSYVTELELMITESELANE